MLARLRSPGGGWAVAAACLVIGVARGVGGLVDLLTGASLVLAGCFALAAVVERRAAVARAVVSGPATGGDDADPMPWTRRPSRLGAWLAAERGYAVHPGEPLPVRSPRRVGRRAVRGALRSPVRGRVGATLAIAAAVTGLVLVLQDPGSFNRHTPAAGSPALPVLLPPT